MPVQTLLWWMTLCLVALVNLAAWAWSARALHRVGHAADATERSLRRLQLLLSAGYVAGCAWRAVLPVYDVPRLSMIDSWAASVLVGRSVATVAELCFAAQWAVLLRAVARADNSRMTLLTARAIVPLIAVAEICSWHAVLTTSNLGHVVEESLWGVCAALVVWGLLRSRASLAKEVRTFALVCSAAGLLYVAYMFAVDVPMYWARWLADEARGRPYLDLAQGWADVSGRWVVSHRWDDWRTEAVWMTAYFSVAVWFSIGLVHAPIWRQARLGAALNELR